METSKVENDERSLANSKVLIEFARTVKQRTSLWIGPLQVDAIDELVRLQAGIVIEYRIEQLHHLV